MQSGLQLALHRHTRGPQNLLNAHSGQTQHSLSRRCPTQGPLGVLAYRTLNSRWQQTHTHTLKMASDQLPFLKFKRET